MPFFSVIIPVYNKQDFIEATLRSVFAQHFTDFELIIVNDGSTDASAQKIEAFSDDRIRYFETTNQGAAAARNLGIANAQSPYISFLDADDYWYPDFLAEMHRNIESFPTQNIFAAAIEIQMPGKVFAAQYSIAPSTQSQVVNYFDASQKTTAICTSCAVFKKEVFEQAGVFDPAIRSGQDTDLWIRLGLIYDVVFCAKILARYVYDAHSLSKNKAFIAQRLNFEKFAETEKNNERLKQFLDLNRYAFALKCRLNGDLKNSRRFSAAIDRKNLPLRKKLLLQMPAAALKLLVQFNLFLVRIGLSNSAFK